MRVLYLTSRFPSAPGEAFLSAEVSALADLGAELYVVPCVRHVGPVPVGRWRDGDGEVIRVDPLRAWTRSWRHPLRAFTLIQCVAPSVVTDRSRTAAQGAARSSVALTLAERFTGRVDHIHAHWADTPATIAMAAARLLDVSWGFTAHRGDIVTATGLNRKVSSASYVHCISAKSREMVVERVGSSTEAKAKSVVRHLGVVLPAVVKRPQTSTLAKSPQIICPAQLKAVKGHRYLIDAVAILRNRDLSCRLLICGDGELLTTLQQHVRDLGLVDNVDFLGDVAQPELFERYRSGEIRAVVLPSVDLGDGEHEGIPVSLIEAMAHGVPVVSTRTGGIPELVASDDVGLLVEPANADALADALAVLLCDSGRAASIGRAARDEVAQFWTAEMSARALLNAMEAA